MIFLRWSARILALLLVACAVWGIGIEPATLRVRETTLHLEHWPASQAGLRVALFADLHPGSPFIDADKIRRVVDMTNATHPDLIVIAGDIFHAHTLGGHFVPPAVTAPILGGLHAPLGVYAVFGNHDVFFNTERLRSLLAAAGITVMDERALRIQQGRWQFWMVGFGDLETTAPNPSLTMSAVTDDAPVIAVTHNPDLFPAIPARANLVLAGHMHGGQIDLPGIGRPIFWRRVFPFGDHYAIGHLAEQTDIYITPGIGTSHLPVRFRVPPQIDVLKLEP